MKTRVWYALTIAMLILSATVFGELVATGDGRTSGSASASASHGNEYDYEDDSGDNGYYTTEAGYFDYYCEASAHAQGSLTIVDGWGAAVAVGSASAGSVSADASVSLSSGSDQDDDGPYIDQDTDVYFSAYSGVSASWDVVAGCQVEEGSYSSASAYANAYAQASMW